MFNGLILKIARARETHRGRARIFWLHPVEHAFPVERTPLGSRRKHINFDKRQTGNI
jgi:hypothetical protein